MDASTRRTVLATAALLALAVAAFAGGGYTLGLLSDQEHTSASIQADSDFGGPSDGGAGGETVSFRGCGGAWLQVPANASFSVTFTLHDASADARETVTLSDADAGSADSGFRYNSGQKRYQFDVDRYYGSTRDGHRIVAAELDGEVVENDHRCADAGSVGGSAADRNGSASTPGETTQPTAETTADAAATNRTPGTTTTNATDESTTTTTTGSTTVTAGSTATTTTGSTTATAEATTITTVRATTAEPPTTPARTGTTAGESASGSETTTDDSAARTAESAMRRGATGRAP